jgi:hypothetical protein
MAGGSPSRPPPVHEGPEIGLSGQTPSHRKVVDGSQENGPHEPGSQPQASPWPHDTQVLSCANTGSLCVTNKAAAPVRAAAKRTRKYVVGFTVCLRLRLLIERSSRRRDEYYDPYQLPPRIIGPMPPTVRTLRCAARTAFVLLRDTRARRRRLTPCSPSARPADSGCRATQCRGSRGRKGWRSRRRR